jgi:hypothetical protein
LGLRQDESYDSEIRIDNKTKIKYHDYSLKCIRQNSITAFIEREINGVWREIGKAIISVETPRIAKWLDIEISQRFRRRGIGSKVVLFGEQTNSE